MLHSDFESEYAEIGENVKLSWKIQEDYCEDVKFYRIPFGEREKLQSWWKTKKGQCTYSRMLTIFSKLS